MSFILKSNPMRCVVYGAFFVNDETRGAEKLIHLPKATK